MIVSHGPEQGRSKAELDGVNIPGPVQGVQTDPSSYKV